jgi:hypothetical protein
MVNALLIASLNLVRHAKLAIALESPRKNNYLAWLVEQIACPAKFAEMQQIGILASNLNQSRIPIEADDSRIAVQGCRVE